MLAPLAGSSVFFLPIQTDVTSVGVYPTNHAST